METFCCLNHLFSSQNCWDVGREWGGRHWDRRNILQLGSRQSRNKNKWMEIWKFPFSAFEISFAFQDELGYFYHQFYHEWKMTLYWPVPLPMHGNFHTITFFSRLVASLNVNRREDSQRYRASKNSKYFVGNCEIFLYFYFSLWWDNYLPG